MLNLNMKGSIHFILPLFFQLFHLPYLWKSFLSLSNKLLTKLNIFFAYKLDDERGSLFKIFFRLLFLLHLYQQFHQL